MSQTTYSPNVSSAPRAQTYFGVQCVWVALACMYTYDALYTYIYIILYIYIFIYVPLLVHLVTSVVRVLYNHTAYIAKSKWE